MTVAVQPGDPLLAHALISKNFPCKTTRSSGHVKPENKRLAESFLGEDPSKNPRSAIL